MMGEQRAKTRGTQCPAEAGRIPSEVSALHLAGRAGLVGEPSSCPDLNGSIRFPTRDHGKSFQRGLGSRVWAGRRARGRTPSPAMAQLHNLLASLGAGFLAAVPGSQQGYPMAGEILIADNCRQAAIVAKWILQHRTLSCPQVCSWPPG